MSLTRNASMVGLALVISACTSYGVVQNKPLVQGQQSAGYTLEEFARVLNRRSDELSLAVAFSGGGTRAAALSYGVMQELRDTRVRLNGREQSLLDSISAISSVSGAASRRPTTACMVIASSWTSRNASCAATWKARCCAAC